MRTQTLDLDSARGSAGNLFDGLDREIGAGATEDFIQMPGEIPRVQADATQAAQATPSASQRAYDQQPGAQAVEEDDNVKELKAKVGALVTSKYGGDYKTAFDHYDADKDAGIKKDEIIKLLEDAGVGNRFTRGAWANGILKKLDKGQDGKVQWDEFQAVF
jgi:hypothetical protein